MHSVSKHKEKKHSKQSIMDVFHAHVKHTHMCTMYMRSIPARLLILVACQEMPNIGFVAVCVKIKYMY